MLSFHMYISFQSMTRQEASSIRATTTIAARSSSMGRLVSVDDRAQASLPLLELGGRVFLPSSKVFGTVRFLGPTRFREGTWAGLELDVPEGKNDGSINGMRYFDCRPNHGLFVRPGVCLVLPHDGRHSGSGQGSTLRFASPSPRRTRSPPPSLPGLATQADVGPGSAAVPSGGGPAPRLAAGPTAGMNDDMMIELIVEVRGEEGKEVNSFNAPKVCLTRAFAHPRFSA